MLAEHPSQFLVLEGGVETIIAPRMLQEALALSLAGEGLVCNCAQTACGRRSIL
jgi:hypothetical protein